MPTYEPWDMNTVLDVDIDGNRLGMTTAGNSITSKLALARGRISNANWKGCVIDGRI